MLSQFGKNICLGNSFVYNKNLNLIFDKNKNVIQLTKKEQKVLHCLTLSLNRTVSYEYLKLSVWGDENTSIDCLRNVINKIRQKTYYDIINNSSGLGYYIKEST